MLNALFTWSTLTLQLLRINPDGYALRNDSAPGTMPRGVCVVSQLGPCSVPAERPLAVTSAVLKDITQ